MIDRRGSSSAYGCIIFVFSAYCILQGADGLQADRVAGPIRGLKQNFMQFSALQDTQATYGGWGGRWELTPMRAPLTSNPQSRAAGNQNGGMRRTVVRSINNRPGRSGVPGSSTGTSGNTAAPAGSTTGSGNIVASGRDAATEGGPGIFTGGNNRREDITDLPRFIPFNGTFVGDKDVGYWTSQNPGSRVDATFLTNSSVTNTTLTDPDPIETVRLPVTSFETGYCIPRQAFLVVNVTSRVCYAGSNLTTWDGEPVCARLDCGWRARGTNVLYSASGCRTVVQRPQSVCPAGCNLIEQLRFNTTVNRTQLVTRCSCKAGNQPCPSTWATCTCYEPLIPRNVTRGFTVCSETQGECERKCNLAVSLIPRLAPLCPIVLDPFLSINATNAPVYPPFGWNMASQGSSNAALSVAAGRNLLQLLGLQGRRRLTMAAPDWQQAVGDSGMHIPNAAVSRRGGGVSGSMCALQGRQQEWGVRMVCLVTWVVQWLRGATPQLT